MKPPHNMRLSESIHYFGVSSVCPDVLISFLQKYEDAEDDLDNLPDIQEENADLAKQVDSLEEDLARAYQKIEDLEYELERMDEEKEST